MATLAAVGGLTVAGAPNAAADDRAIFELPFGATYYSGTIEFYNRSVVVAGSLRGLSTGCRRGYALSETAWGLVLDDNTTSATCTGPVHREIHLTADVAGGARIVQVWLVDEDNGVLLVGCSVTRGGDRCVRIP
ncbi:Secreted protein [Nocardia ninae]|uniref:Uncharacterized protein n=1 Tax=Nocardia ninae NBRC 108245 TaxID=1210091 RepID=A0A511MPG8_9NOCA|nr:hypothetical protein NN4_70340 [Nocardia ninae NBRC 108245]